MKKRKEFLPFGKPVFSSAELEAVGRVLSSGWVGMGPETIAFEEELAEFIGVSRVVTVNSCTSALFLSLLVNGIGPGDEVICPSLTWCSTANVALYLGARVVFCDVDPVTLCITPDTVRAKLTDRTRAVMVVHMGGLAADVHAIRDVLPDGVALVEDAAHALGARYRDGNMVGAAGNLTCYSFYANKNLSTGEGGGIAVEDPELAERLVSLRLHGLSSDAWKRFSHPDTALTPYLQELGYKMNYTDLQAAIGRVQLRRQPQFAKIRMEIAQCYEKRLREVLPELEFQAGITSPGHARHLFLVLLPRERYFSMSRNDILLALRERNIGASIHYAPLHRMPLYAASDTSGLEYTEDVCDRLLTLPISASMSLEDANEVVDILAELLDESRVSK